MIELLNPGAVARTQPIYDRIAKVVTPAEWELFAPYVDAINRLKRERNAVILAHNYQTPEIFHGVADIVGDSLALAREACKVEAEIIIVCGVHFMGETAKIMNPTKTVVVPDARAGCSLAESITADDVRALRVQYPGVPVVTYVNTSAAVKAESDICCTSANAVKIVESLGVPRVLMLPDAFLASYVASNTAVEIIPWHGHCEVHERFRAIDVANLREGDDGVLVIGHPECPPDVLAAVDFAGSTAAMIDFVRNHQDRRVVMLTECSMSDNVAAEFSNVDFVRPCNLCPHMKRSTLPKILRSLETLQDEVLVDEAVRVRAKRALDAMVAV
jgi:quinolinate synthase